MPARRSPSSPTPSHAMQAVLDRRWLIRGEQWQCAQADADAAQNRGVHRNICMGNTHTHSHKEHGRPSRPSAWTEPAPPGQGSSSRNSRRRAGPGPVDAPPAPRFRFHRARRRLQSTPGRGPPLLTDDIFKGNCMAPAHGPGLATPFHSPFP